MRPNHPRTYRALVSALTLALVAGLSLSLAGPAQAKKRGLTNFDSLKGQIIPSEMFGLHVKNEQYGVWPSISFGSLRLWDNDVAWSNIETAPGVYNWTNLDNAINNARAKGVTDIMYVIAGTPALFHTHAPVCMLTEIRFTHHKSACSERVERHSRVPPSKLEFLPPRNGKFDPPPPSGAPLSCV